MQITRQMMYDAWKRVQDWVSGASSDRPKVVNVNGAGAEIFTDAMPGAVKLTGSKVEEQKTESDATSNVITFSEPIQSIEIYHDEATPQTFVVNGLSLKIASGGWRSPVGGTPSAQVTIPAGVSCIVSRLV